MVFWVLGAVGGAAGGSFPLPELVWGSCCGVQRPCPEDRWTDGRPRPRCICSSSVTALTAPDGDERGQLVHPELFKERDELITAVNEWGETLGSFADGSEA